MTGLDEALLPKATVAELLRIDEFRPGRHCRSVGLSDRFRPASHGGRSDGP